MQLNYNLQNTATLFAIQYTSPMQNNPQVSNRLLRYERVIANLEQFQCLYIYKYLISTYFYISGFLM